MSDPWSGIPDDLRKLVEAYDDATRACVRALETRDTDADVGAQYDYACERRLIPEAALCAALRALVADRERLRWLMQYVQLSRSQIDIKSGAAH